MLMCRLATVSLLHWPGLAEPAKVHSCTVPLSVGIASVTSTSVLGLPSHCFSGSHWFEQWWDNCSIAAGAIEESKSSDQVSGAVQCSLTGIFLNYRDVCTCECLNCRITKVSCQVDDYVDCAQECFTNVLIDTMIRLIRLPALPMSPHDVVVVLL